LQVVSASYRTDIPAFYGDWFTQRVREGYVQYHNPYGPQLVTVSLKPEDVHAILFWSKNYQPFLKHLPILDFHQLDYYCHYAITGYSATPATHALEERVPHPIQTIDSFRLLVQHCNHDPRYVHWRYDPIIFTPIIDGDWHRRTFRWIAERLAGWTHRCYFSFLDAYSKVARNISALPAELQPYDPSQEDKQHLARDLADIAARYEMTLYTCAEDFAAIAPIQRGACVDKAVLDELWPHKQRPLKLCANRGKCGCYDNRDIGAYDTCPHGCVYCYAVRNRSLALSRFRAHDPALPTIMPRTRASNDQHADTSESSEDPGSFIQHNFL
jgi:hypothetical protein